MLNPETLFLVCFGLFSNGQLVHFRSDVDTFSYLLEIFDTGLKDLHILFPIDIEGNCFASAL